MIVLFTEKMGGKFNNQEWKSEATDQFLLHIKYLYNKEDSLFYIGWILKMNIISVKPILTYFKRCSSKMTALTDSVL